VAQFYAAPGQKAERMMNSNRETVKLAGRLSGMGNEAECTVSALKVSLPRLNTWEYVKCDIHLAPESLPDGQYRVTFEGRTMQVKKQDGDWVDGAGY
jgi:hypothetical protein